MAFYFDEQGLDTEQRYGITYACDHPLYDECTLYQHEDGRGLTVIQQHFDEESKCTWWGHVEEGFSDELYLQAKFPTIFNRYAKHPTIDGLYPFICLRPLMHMLGLRPLKREYWETRF